MKHNECDTTRSTKNYINPGKYQKDKAGKSTPNPTCHATTLELHKLIIKHI